MAIVTPTDRPKSARNRYEIDVFGRVFFLCCHFCFLDITVGVGAFVIGLSHIYAFFSQLCTDLSANCDEWYSFKIQIETSTKMYTPFLIGFN